MESIFKKAEKCNSVKIWSKMEMGDDMLLYGWGCFNRYQLEISTGKASESGCVYSNDFFGAYAKKTGSGMCSVLVWREE